MKKFIRNPITIIISITLCIIILALLGFRITYNPDLNICWEAISALASCAAVVVSAIAIYYAIQIPLKIANDQNKISLFEKRYEAFQFFERCFAFKKALQSSETIEDMRKDCLLFFDNINYEELDIKTLRNKLHHFEYILHEMEFLFPELTEEDVSSLYQALYEAVLAIASNENTKEKISTYITTMGEFSLKYNKAIWSKLYL